MKFQRKPIICSKPVKVSGQLSWSKGFTQCSEPYFPILCDLVKLPMSLFSTPLCQLSATELHCPQSLCCFCPVFSFKQTYQCENHCASFQLNALVIETYFMTYFYVFRCANQLPVPLGLNAACRAKALFLLLKSGYEIHKAAIHSQALCKWRQKREISLLGLFITVWGIFPQAVL